MFATKGNKWCPIVLGNITFIDTPNVNWARKDQLEKESDDYITGRVGKRDGEKERESGRGRSTVKSTAEKEMRGERRQKPREETEMGGGR